MSNMSLALLETNLLLLVLSHIGDCVDEIIENIGSLLARHIREQRRLNRALPAKKQQVSWLLFSSNVSSVNFRFEWKKVCFSG